MDSRRARAIDGGSQRCSVWVRHRILGEIVDKSFVGWVGLDLGENDARLSEGHTGVEQCGASRPSPTTVSLLL